MHWDTRLKLGIEALDTQHREIVEAASEACEAQRERDHKTLRQRLLELMRLSAEHFVFEEQMMLETQYPKIAIHSEHHAEILGQLERFSRLLLEGRASADGERIMRFLTDWIASHIARFDRDFADYLVSVEQEIG
jgi:hemerythrin-like metal-binding protein